MKNLKILTLGILLAGMHLTSCKKGADQQPQLGTPAQIKDKVFEKSLTIYNADKTNSTTLRFRAASKEQLDNMGLENVEFTLVKTLESATEATDVAAATSPGSSNMDASLLQSTNENQVLPEDGIQVDLPFWTKTESISIQVKSKNLNSGTMAKAPAALITNAYTSAGANKIRVTNNGPSPIYVQFRNWHNNQWHDVGPRHTLNQFDDEVHRNCLYQVGAKVDHPSPINYIVTFWPGC